MKRYLILALLLLIAPPATVERTMPEAPILISVDGPERWLVEESDWTPMTAVRPEQVPLDLRSFEIDNTTVPVKVRPDGLKVTGTWRY